MSYLHYECNMLLWTFYKQGPSALILNAKARDPANNNWEKIPQKSTFVRVAMWNTARNSYLSYTIFHFNLPMSIFQFDKLDFITLSLA